ncbi:autotransporter family protein [Burkholderia sp. 3C]
MGPEIIPTPVQPTQAPEPDAYLGNAMASEMMTVHTLHQRQGQAPGMKAADAAGGIDGAAWARVEGNTASYGGGGRDLSTNTYLVHAGSDVFRFKLGNEGSVRVGAMAMYGNSNVWSKREMWNPLTNSMADSTANGHVDGYNVGVYGTWYGNKDILTGPYVDTWFMYGKYNNTVGGSLATDSYGSRTLTGSIEAGYSMPLYLSGTTQLYIEPEAQVVYSNYSADAHSAPAGEIGRQNSNNVLTRLGVRLHGVDTRGKIEMRPFVEANWWHGTGSQSVNISGNTFSLDTPRDRMELKVGLQGQFGKHWSGSIAVGGQTSFGHYTSMSGQIATKYSWK